MEAPRSTETPAPARDVAEFWAACEQGRLVVQRCVRDGRLLFPPRLEADLGGAEWVGVSGRGTVHTWLVAYRAAFPGTPPQVHPEFLARLPYIVAIVALDEAPDDLRMVTNVVDCPPEAMRVDLPVEVTFRPGPGGRTLPYFRPVAE